MRSFTVFVLFTAFTAALYGQEENGATSDTEIDGFGGPVVRLTSINGQRAFMIGGRGGWIFDHSLIIGGGLYALSSEVDAAADIFPAQGPLDVDFGCFGFEIEYVPQPHELLHYNLYAFVGGGAVRFLKDVGSFSRESTQVEETNWVFVFEPAANAEFNVTTWCRVTAGISYRITAGVNQIGLGNGDFTGLDASLALKLGSF